MKIIFQLFSGSSMRALCVVVAFLLVFGLLFQIKSSEVESETHITYPKVQLFSFNSRKHEPAWKSQLAQWLTFGKQTVFALPDTEMGFSIEPKREVRKDRPQEMEVVVIPVTPIDELVGGTIPFPNVSVEDSFQQNFQSLADKLPERPPINWVFPTSAFWEIPGGFIVTYLPKFSDEELDGIEVDDVPTRTVLSFDLLPASRPRVRVMESCGNSELDLMAYRRLSLFLHSSWGDPRMQKKVLNLLEMGNSTTGTVIAEWRFRSWKK